MVKEKKEKFLAAFLLFISLGILLALFIQFAINLKGWGEVREAFFDIPYQQICQDINEASVEKSLLEITGLGSRIAGYPGAHKTAELIKRKLIEFGWRGVREENFKVTVPVDEGATLSIEGSDGGEIRLYSLWPNLVRSSSTPREGLQGPLIYVGDSRLERFNGKEVNGAIVLLDFNCGTNWLAAPLLGAKAVIFLEPEDSSRFEAQQKFLSVPANIPRFWLPREDAQRLLELCRSKAPPVTVKARMSFQQLDANNILAFLPGSDPKLARERLLIQTYFDSISVVPALAPGAQSACNLVALLKVARALERLRPKRPVVILATSGHFQSLAGIRNYVKEVRKNPQATENIALCLSLDLTSATDEVGIFVEGGYTFRSLSYYQTYFRPISRRLDQYSRRITHAFPDIKPLFNGVIIAKGWPWSSFIPSEIALDNEMLLMNEMTAMALVTTNDSRMRLDTPFDTPDKVNIENLTRETKLITALIAHIASDPAIPTPRFGAEWEERVGLLRGRVVEFDPRRSFIPEKPVPRSLVVSYSTHREGTRKAYLGVRGHIITTADEEGFYEIPGLEKRVPRRIEAYYIDPITGEIEYAPDLGERGATSFPIDFTLRTAEMERPVVVFRCEPTTLVDLLDQRYLKTYPNLELFDAATDFHPDSFGFSLPTFKAARALSSDAENTAVVYLPPNLPFKLTMSSTVIGRNLILLNSSRESPLGQGFLGEGSLVFTPYRIAQDIYHLDEMRMKSLDKFKIVNKRLNELHAQTARSLDLARASLTEKRYDAFLKYSREAWGYESRAYPDVERTANDTVKGALFYLALTLPFVFFLERLLFGFVDIKKQIIANALIFAAIFAIFSRVHPAFSLALNPFLVLLSFIMFTLAALVICVIASKFQREMRQITGKEEEVHRADVGRISASYAAFMLGIANMRRRKVRTTLTLITLIVLTFTVLSFTSVKVGIKYNRFPLIVKPPYDGLLIRDVAWRPLEAPALSIVENSFSGEALVVPRAWYLSTRTGIDSAVMAYGPGGKTYDLSALVGLSPSERLVTGLDKKEGFVGRWFQEGEDNAVIIPAGMASTLGITQDQLEKVTVSIFGIQAKVVGIIDESLLERSVDVDGEPFMPVDAEELSKDQLEPEQEVDVLVAGELKILPHLGANEIAILPYETVRRLGGTLRSIAVCFLPSESPTATVDRWSLNDERLTMNAFIEAETPETSTTPRVKEVIEKLLPRFSLTVFAADKERSYAYSSAGLTSFGGIKNIFVPLLIAGLIVLNTMLGSVYERTKEIGIYSAVGLAPVHVATLFIAEAAVYAILGAIIGYLLGQVVAKVAATVGLLGALTLNYSSLSAMTSTSLVMVCVVLSTLYPAHLASRLAVPEIERRLRLPEPEGTHWRIQLPLTIAGADALPMAMFLRHYLESFKEYSIGTFYTENPSISKRESPYGPEFILSSTVWLAPFDLGVSQEMEIQLKPDEDPELYSLELVVDKLTGDLFSWKRTNRRFVSRIRKQLLIWRTVPWSAKERYGEEGKAALARSL